MALLRRDIGKFLSTSPLRGTTHAANDCGCGLHISIHVPLAGDDWLLAPQGYQRLISIHVPLAGDDSFGTTGVVLVVISIHVPLAGDDV